MLSLGVGELVILFAILLLFFGASRLPRFARSLGEARRELTEAKDANPS